MLAELRVSRVVQDLDASFVLSPAALLWHTYTLKGVEGRAVSCQ